MIAWPDGLLDHITTLLLNGETVQGACGRAAARFNLETAQVRQYFYRNKPENLSVRGSKSLNAQQSQLVVQSLCGLAMGSMPLTSSQARQLILNVFGVRMARSTFRDWLKRHKSSLKLAKPKPIAKKRITSDKVDEVRVFLDQVKDILSPEIREQAMIANFDETSVDFDKTTQYVISKRGLDQTNLLCRKSKDTCCILSVVEASGEKLYSVLISRTGKNESEGFYEPDGSPDGVPIIPRNRGHIRTYKTASGKLSQTHFHEVMTDFVVHFRSLYPKTLLFLFGDQAPCHTNSHTREELLRNEIHLCFFPSNVSHFLQPLDSVPFANFKAAFPQRYRELTLCPKYADYSNRYLVHLAVLRAEHESISPQAIAKGFELTGLVPFDPEMVLRKALNMGSDDGLMDEIGKLNAYRVKVALETILVHLDDRASSSQGTKIEKYGLFTATTHHEFVQAQSLELSSPKKKPTGPPPKNLEDVRDKEQRLCLADGCGAKQCKSTKWVVCTMCNHRFCPKHKNQLEAHSETCILHG